jgi:hypothetical protein
VLRAQVLHRRDPQVVLRALAQALLGVGQRAHAWPPLAVQARLLEAV